MKVEDIVKIVRETDAIFFNEAYRKDVAKKAEWDYVTRADKEISSYLRTRLKEEFPEVDFMSEEEEMSLAEGKDYWILDPIDGTTNFMQQVDLCAVSLALCSGGEIVAGVIYIPYKKEIFWAEKGKGAYLNGERIECSKAASLSESLAIMEFNAYFKNESEVTLQKAARIFSECHDIRVFGSAAADLAYIACGRASAFLGRFLKPWDYAAGVIIVNEAGGKVSELDGKLHITEFNRDIIAANPLVYEDFLDLFRKTEK